MAERDAEHADTEDDRWQQIRRRPRACTAPSWGPTARRGRPEARARRRAPTGKREVGNVVPGRDEALREVSVPALGAADVYGIEAVVDDADPHGRILPG